MVVWQVVEDWVVKVEDGTVFYHFHGHETIFYISVLCSFETSKKKGENDVNFRQKKTRLPAKSFFGKISTGIFSLSLALLDKCKQSWSAIYVPKNMEWYYESIYF